MESDAERGTFTSVAETLKRAEDRCLAAQHNLQSLIGDGKDPLALACRDIADYQQSIARLLSEFAQRGPENLLTTRLQNTPVESKPAPPASAEDAVANLVTLNSEICHNLREIASGLTPPDQAEGLEELCDELETLSRKISMKSVTLQDA